MTFGTRSCLQVVFRLFRYMLDHKKDVLVGVSILDGYLRMMLFPDPEDFVGERLPDGFYAAKVKNDRTKLFDTGENAACL